VLEFQQVLATFLVAQGIQPANTDHVEVFQMVSVRTSILGRPRRLSRDRHAGQPHTLNCDEPFKPTKGKKNQPLPEISR
jgi:hypothetical protein